MARRILVVDDSETSLFLVQSIFEDNSAIDYILESDSQKALQTLYDNSIDLIVLDLMMPALDGFEFLSRIKKDEQTQNVPVIALTALQDSESEKRAMELGANDYLRKPIDIDELEQKINLYL